ncbi:hypothetical protein B0G71_2570 [Paraburkholderia sp. BL27I4N3]|uniref:hypothetical protein n=1 Tax=Paraburkholderia sp. BL27I4N3 TaxID=1938805 RepID=UPI000E373717|nr:hypothetical protein [Paraburkholderia sp. BL27I4N3]REE19473.1 hypothetical protein B0G71_2570 [Paraburkholderia sp. BL27I4N3]
MAGGAYIVRRGANGVAPSQFNGQLPGSGSGVKQSNRFGAAGSPVQYDRNVEDWIRAGAMPESLRDGTGASWSYQTHPFEYAAAAGLVPATDQDAENLRKYPELALHGLAGTTNQDVGRFHSSAVIVGPRTIHAVGGTNTPADCRCTFRMIAGRL